MLWVVRRSLDYVNEDDAKRQTHTGLTRRERKATYSSRDRIRLLRSSIIVFKVQYARFQDSSLLLANLYRSSLRMQNLPC